MSLAHLLCDNAATKLVDDNRGWTMSRAFPWSSFPNLQDIVFGFAHISVTLLSNNSNIKHMSFADEFTCNNNLTLLSNTALEGEFVCPISGTYTTSGNTLLDNIGSIDKVRFPKLKGMNVTYGTYDGVIKNCSNLKEVYADQVQFCETQDNNHKHLVIGCTALEKIVLGTFTSPLYDWKVLSIQYDSYPNLIHFEIGEGTAVNINLSYWNPTDKGTAFLENFLHHIAERLAVGPTTNRLTLTLSADVYSACGFGATIDDPTDIRYQIKKAIQDRNWKVTDGTNNFNQ